MTLRAAVTFLCVLAALGGACKRQPERASPSPPPPMTVTPITPAPASPLPTPLPDTVATVNGSPILLRNARIIAEQALLGKVPTPGEEAGAYRRAMEQLIARELLYQEAVQRRIEPDPGSVERLRKAVRTEYKDEKAFRSFLSSQGLDPKTFVEELRKRSMVEILLKSEADKVPETVPDEEAMAYYAANPRIFESAGQPVPFEQVRENITKQLVTFKRSEALNTFLTRLRSAAKIETHI